MFFRLFCNWEFKNFNCFKYKALKSFLVFILFVTFKRVLLFLLEWIRCVVKLR